ncbi:MAG TPA: histidine kinase dimerization/phospho-acceptor domain-containing protein, partial [Solirubrobacterales bacterium]|nr:histidine kinase dimerization/phospho-acceptor domain-containing protein [Solirubrobacterales bacterium]
MRQLRLTPLGNRITTISLAIGIGTSAIVYVWVVAIGGHGEAARPILIGGVISLLLSGGVGYYFAYLAVARIRRIDEAAREVAEGNFATRLPVDHAGQLGQLARTFNEMQLRLAELDGARKQFIANASHELRTPIFSLGGFLELLEDDEPSAEERAEFLRTMREQIERLTKLTSDLLNLSQLDAGGVELDPADV